MRVLPPQGAWEEWQELARDKEALPRFFRMTHEELDARDEEKDARRREGRPARLTI